MDQIASKKYWTPCFVDKVDRADEWSTIRFRYFIFTRDVQETTHQSDEIEVIRVGLSPVTPQIIESVPVIEQNPAALTVEQVRYIFDEYPAKFSMNLTQGSFTVGVNNASVAKILLGPGPASDRGQVLRFSIELLRAVLAEPSTNTLRVDLDDPGLTYLPGDTIAFSDWNTEVIGKIKSRYYEKTEKNLNVRFGRDKK
jgi:hypothetical protein